MDAGQGDQLIHNRLSFPVSLSVLFSLFMTFTYFLFNEKIGIVWWLIFSLKNFEDFVARATRKWTKKTGVFSLTYKFKRKKENCSFLAGDPNASSQKPPQGCVASAVRVVKRCQTQVVIFHFRFFSFNVKFFGFK